MNAEKLILLRRILIKAAVLSSGVQVEYPTWRFDGKELTDPEDLAMFYIVPVSEIKEHLAQKDIHSASGEGTVTRGIGTRLSRSTIRQRANALAYGVRRRRRHKRRSEKP